jgi:hypothetical protein
LGVALSGAGQGDIRVLPERHKLLLALKAVGPPQKFSPGRVTQKQISCVSHSVGFVSRFRSFDFSVGQRHLSFTNAFKTNVPSLSNKSTTRHTITDRGCPRTVLDGKSRKTRHLPGI